MTKFVYISNEYRNAWWTYIINENGQFESNYDKSFLEEFEFKLDEEKHFLKISSVIRFLSLSSDDPRNRFRFPKLFSLT